MKTFLDVARILCNIAIAVLSIATIVLIMRDQESYDDE